MRKLYIIFLYLTMVFVGCATTPVVAPPNIQKVVTKVGYRVVRWDSLSSFFDDFSKYSIGTVAPFGPWQTVNADAHIISAVQPDGLIGNVLEINRGLININTPYKYFILELNAKDGEPKIYFLLNQTGSAGYYVFRRLGSSSPVELYKFAGSSKLLVGKSAQINIPSSNWQYWKIVVGPEKIKIYLNGVKAIEIPNNDPTIQSGGIGLGTNFGTHYDNVKVTILLDEKNQ